MGKKKRGAWFKFVDKSTNKEVDCCGDGWKYLISPDNAVYKYSWGNGYDVMGHCPSIEARVFCGTYIGGFKAHVGDTVQRIVGGCVASTGKVYTTHVQWEGNSFTPLRDFASIFHEEFKIVDGECNG